MNKLVSCIVTFFVFITFSQQVMSKEFVVSYDGFYDRLKVVNKGEFQYARVNFYITDIATNDVCKIKTGKIITEQQEFALSYTEQAQLLLPFDKKLDSDKAVIVITPENDAHDCQLKMQIEATELADFTINKANLAKLNTEFEQLLADLSGFFVSKLMWFLLPEQKGLVLHFDDVQAPIDGMTCDEQVCKVAVPDNWQDDTSQFNIRGKLEKVTPWIVK